MTDAVKKTEGAASERTTVTKIANILEDAVDLIGLGLQVARDVRELTTNPRHGQSLREEAEARANRIRDSRKKET